MPDDQLSLAIGRRGQNVRLASQLTGWDIDILTEAEESERRQRGIPQPLADVHRRARRRRRDRASAGDRRLHLGRGSGLRRRSRSWPAIEGFDEEIAEELQRSARRPISSSRDEKLTEKRRASSASSDELAAIEGLTPGDAGHARRGRRQDAATISPISPTDELIDEMDGVLKAHGMSSSDDAERASSWRRAPIGSPTRRRPEGGRRQACARTRHGAEPGRSKPRRSPQPTRWATSPSEAAASARCIATRARCGRRRSWSASSSGRTATSCPIWPAGCRGAVCG